LCMYNCVRDGLWRTIALSAWSVLIFHIFLWHCKRSLYSFSSQMVKYVLGYCMSIFL
jgi:hypothetical protein